MRITPFASASTIASGARWRRAATVGIRGSALLL
jgi:hypothetical protein